MRIKAIRKTDQYKHIEFGGIKDSWADCEVLTPSGFTPVKYFGLVKSAAPTVTITTSHGRLVCDPFHRVKLSTGATAFASDLNPECDTLVGYGGEVVKFVIGPGPISDLYDIEIESPHWYYTAGVVSHNSITLVNNSIANVLQARKVLYVTLEMSDLMSALRALGALTNKPVMKNKASLKDEVLAIVNKLKSTGEIGDLAFHEFPPDEISVDHIYSLLNDLRRNHSWVPDVICIDYLELMLSRRETDNKDDYTRQKGVATQLRGLAQNTNSLVFSATQTNRSGNNSDGPIDITKIAESYGKTMPLDYLVSINQTAEEYNSQFDPNSTQKKTVFPAPARLYIVKNRTGPKFQTVNIRINYNTMNIQEVV